MNDAKIAPASDSNQIEADDEYIAADMKVGEYTLKEFRVKFHTTSSSAAIDIIKDYMKAGGDSSSVCRYITHGRENVKIKLL